MTHDPRPSLDQKPLTDNQRLHLLEIAIKSVKARLDLLEAASRGDSA